MSGDAIWEPPPPGVLAFMGELSGRDRTGPFTGVVVQCAPRTGRVVELRGLESREPGHGRGTLALAALMDLADACDVDLLIQPDPRPPCTADRLEGWYRRLGCVDSDEPGRLAYGSGWRAEPAGPGLRS